MGYRRRRGPGLGLRQRQARILDETSVYCSTEQKSIDAAAILAEHLSLGFHQVEALGENDRSATGLLPPDVFERVADHFFGSPDKSIRGWVRAVDAQSRIVRAVEKIGKTENGNVAIVSHGAVGTLVYCHLAGEPIARRWDQPPNGGGNYYRFTLSPRAAHFWWRAFDG